MGLGYRCYKCFHPVEDCRCEVLDLQEELERLRQQVSDITSLWTEACARNTKLEAVAAAAEARCAACLPDTREFEDERLRIALTDLKEAP